MESRGSDVDLKRLVFVDDADSHFPTKETDQALPDKFIGVNGELYALETMETQALCYLEDGNPRTMMTRVSLDITVKEPHGP